MVTLFTACGRVTSHLFYIFQCDNIFNPLTTVHTEALQWPKEKFYPDTHFVLFREQLHCGGVVSPSEHNVLWSFATDFSSCSSFRVPARRFGIATYNSQLVLVGGGDGASQEYSDKLWTSDDGLVWSDGTLPPMPTPRMKPLAVSFGNPECLLVAGGYSIGPERVEVLKERQWFKIAEPLPRHLSPPWHCTLHNGVLYMCRDGNFVCCTASALLTKCIHPESKLISSGLWKTMKRPYHDNYSKKRTKHYDYTLMSSDGQLLAFTSSIMFAYSPHKQSWIYTGRSGLPDGMILFQDCGAVSLPTGIFLSAKLDRLPNPKLFRISFKGEQIENFFLACGRLA